MSALCRLLPLMPSRPPEVVNGRVGNGMEYTVRFVEDAELPPPHDWALFRDGVRKILVVRESRVCPAVIEDIWRAFHKVNGSN